MDEDDLSSPEEVFDKRSITSGFDRRQRLQHQMSGTPMRKKQTAPAMADTLSETEQDLLSHLQNGYELDTDSLGGDPLLRTVKSKEVIRPLSATRNTVKALEERGLIAPAKGADPLRIAWQLSKTKAKKQARR
jgi:hypothetical protein